MSTYGSTARGRRIRDEDLQEFGKGIGIAPVLARKVPAAGRGGRRIVTGDQVNARRIIGKSDEVSKLSFRPLGSALKNPGQLGSGLKAGWQAGRTGATRLASPANAGGRVGMSIGAAAGRNPVKTGAIAGGLGVGGLTAGNGMNNRYKPQPAYSPYGGFGKRSYDPEANRRYREGAAASATGIGAGALTISGARGVRRDAKALKEVRNSPRPTATSERPSRPRVQRTRRGTPLTPQQLAMAEAKHARDMHNYVNAGEGGRLADKARALPKGAIVTGRNAAKLGGGVALLGTSAALFRNRNEERWD